MQKFETLRQPLLWFWIAVVRTRTRKEEKRKNIAKIVATFNYASSQGQRTHSARTKICIQSKLVGFSFQNTKIKRLNVDGTNENWWTIEYSWIFLHFLSTLVAFIIFSIYYCSHLQYNDNNNNNIFPVQHKLRYIILSLMRMRYLAVKLFSDINCDLSLPSSVQASIQG